LSHSQKISHVILLVVFYFSIEEPGRFQAIDGEYHYDEVNLIIAENLVPSNSLNKQAHVDLKENHHASGYTYGPGVSKKQAKEALGWAGDFIVAVRLHLENR
jgi:hypothetical protein